MSDAISESKQSDRAFYGAIERYNPPASTPTAYRCRRVRIPDDLHFVAALNELISRLGFPEFWRETIGNMTPDECAALGSQLFYDYAESDGYCMIGAILPFAGQDLPGNMLECDGSTHNRVDYPALYVILDENFIVDPDTFRTPDLRGRMILGASDDYSIDSQGGTAYQGLAIENLPAHTHVQDAHTHVQDAHTHVQNAHNHDQQAHSHNSAPHSHPVTDPQHNHNITHSHTVQARSSSAAGANAEFMRSNGTGSDADFSTGNPSNTNSGNAATGITLGTGIAVIDNTIAANVATTATNNATTAVNQNTTAVNQNTGGNVPHNNLPPYRALRMVIVAR